MKDNIEHRIEDPQGLAFSIDPLLQCLVLFTQLYHKPFSAEALMAGLPLSPKDETQGLYNLKESKGLFARAASRAGLKSTLVTKRLGAISSLQLPMILLLKNTQEQRKVILRLKAKWKLSMVQKNLITIFI